MNKIKVGLLSIGLGNISSVKGVIKILNYNCLVSNKKNDLKECDILIIPGVGSFGSAVDALQNLKLYEFVKTWSEKNKPLIGICLGMQLFGKSSEESENKVGLSIIDCKVRKINNGISHIGWNNLNFLNTKKLNKSKYHENFYFNHSFF